MLFELPPPEMGIHAFLIGVAIRLLIELAGTNDE